MTNVTQLAAQQNNFDFGPSQEYALFAPKRSKGSLLLFQIHFLLDYIYVPKSVPYCPPLASHLSLIFSLLRTIDRDA